MYKQIIDSFNLKFLNYGSMECKVPCSLYSVLMDNKIIEDPYYGDNEKKYIDIARNDCEFNSNFDIDREVLDNKRLTLKFMGIDTIADIYLNDIFLGHTDNMHRTWSFDIGGIARERNNLLRVCFKSAIKFTEKENSRFRLYSPDCSLEGYGHIRKTYCSFGWDWGPTIADMGFYRDIIIEGSSSAELQELEVEQIHNEDKVTLKIYPHVTHFSGSETVEIMLTVPDGKRIIKKSSCNQSVTIDIDNPQLWFPNGYGQQNLYELRTMIFDGETAVSENNQKIGLRTLTVSTAPDRWGNEFCFVVNGLKIFSMGANYIPMDAILNRVNRQRTEKLLTDCVAANFNTVRVWGGGYYPDDYFYELCDELGLMVWQDFMFACSSVYLYDAFQKNIEQEVIEFVKRIRNHACIGLLCGNNEVEMAWHCWNLPNHVRQKNDYIQIFEKIIPELCKKYAKDIFYWPSSPSSTGSFVNPDDQNMGDGHCWEIWHGSEPFENYRNKFFRFCSEYGYEAFPSIKTLREIATGRDLNPFSPVMDAHQKCKNGNMKIVSKTADYFMYVNNFRDFIYISQLMQAEAIRHGAEHFRRNRGRCMGSIYWQLNDNWQTASWSSIDYRQRWKALHYFAKRFYAPVLLSALENGYDITLNISNETLDNFEGSIEWNVFKNDLTIISSGTIDVSMDKLSARNIVTLSLEDTIKGMEQEAAFGFRLKQQDRIISEDVILFCRPKQFKFLKPNLNISLRESEQQIGITIETDVFVKNLEIDFKEIDSILSDNYISFIDRSKRTVYLQKCRSTAQQIKEQLVINCINYLNNIDLGG